jgi:hypothetical protein
MHRTIGGMKQSNLGLDLTTKKTRKREFLEEMDRVVPWSELVELIEPHSPRANTGRPLFPIQTMLRIHFLQQWFGLSDPAMEEALFDMPMYREFAQLPEGIASRPYATTRPASRSRTAIALTDNPAVGLASFREPVTDNLRPRWTSSRYIATMQYIPAAGGARAKEVRATDGSLRSSSGKCPDRPRPARIGTSTGCTTLAVASQGCGTTTNAARMITGMSMGARRTMASPRTSSCLKTSGQKSSAGGTS